MDIEKTYALLRIEYANLKAGDRDEIEANIEAAVDLCDDYGKWSQDMSDDATGIGYVEVLPYNPMDRIAKLVDMVRRLRDKVWEDEETALFTPTIVEEADALLQSLNP